jgi:deferrochelatase/peroxidase EfeB
MAAITCVVLALTGVIAPAAPAFAHDVGGVGATNFHTTINSIEPAVPGVTVTVIENGSRLELRNSTGTDVVLLGYSGEPYAKIGPTGAYVNDDSPATYLNADRFSLTTVPAYADATKPPVWDRVDSQPVFRWHDHRTHWMLTTVPPIAAAAPNAFHHLTSWTVGFTYGAQNVTVAGSLDWVPGPSPVPWFALMALLVIGVVAATFLQRPHRILAGAVLAVVVGQIVHGVGISQAIVGTVPQKLGAIFGYDAPLMWPVALIAAWLLWRGHARAIWLAAGAGLFIAVSLIVDDAPLWWRSSAPSGLALTANRFFLALSVGAGFGLVAAVSSMLRRHAPPPRPWAPSPVLEESTMDNEPAPKPRPAAASAKPTASSKPVASSKPTASSKPAAARSGAAALAAAAKAAGAKAAAAKASVTARVRGAADPTDEINEEEPNGIGRRQLAGFLAAGAIGAVAGGTLGATFAGRSSATPPAAAASGPALSDVGARAIAFRGTRQAGIATPIHQQARVWVAAFDLAPGTSRQDLGALLDAWTRSTEALTTAQPLGTSDDAVVTGLGPSALTVTVGFGPSLFGKAGLPLSARPAALAPLPAFPGERLDPARSDGDLGLVVAADDALTVAHAARVLSRQTNGVASLRWSMSGFNAARGAGSDTQTGRNLMGQVDGSNNPKPTDPDFEARVFVPATEPVVWLRGGSYLVVRRIRMVLDDWDQLGRPAQEAVIGRRRDNGAPLSGGTEFTAADYGKRDAGGNLVIPANAHIRLATPASNDGAAMLRRGFSYSDGVDEGLLFLAWQADPRHGFIPVQRNLLAHHDALHQFIQHETSALFVAPGGVGPGEYIGQHLLEG